MRIHFVLILPLAAALYAQNVPKAKEDPIESRTAETPKHLPGFDINALDRSANPCANFYQYACGTWLKENPIPADQSTWGRFSELEERNRQILREILENAAAHAQPGAIDQKIGDYYAACMDEPAIERKGAAPLQPELDRIAALRNKSGLQDEIVRLHRQGISVFFTFSSNQDFKDSSQVIAEADQGGLGLPDRDYYLKTDAKSVELRNQYVDHVRKMFELLGDESAKAQAGAKAVMAIETELAKGSLDLVTRRDPNRVYHKMTEHELTSLCPFLNWPKYFEGMGAPPVSALNVAVPNFFRQFETTLVEHSLEDLQTYLRWHVLSSQAALLSSPFVNENFDFNGRKLTGAKELRPRWKRCVAAVDGDLGEALGQRYVEQTFGAEGKQRTLKMVKAIEKSLGDDIRSLDWMTPATKQKALEKLAAIANKIGYPEKWRDYSALVIDRGDVVGNSLRANAFEVRRQLSKIGKPVDPSEWTMTPPTVNAYYDPQLNNINFPAGILQPPFYDNQMDDPVNFGGIGAVIGHELTHGFDDEGRQFDPKGNLRDWWTEKDAKAFEERAQCLANQYGSYTAVDSVKVNGKLTLGENTADNGGLRVAFMALMDTLAKNTPKLQGFTPEQRFFLGWGQIWCQNTRDEAARLRATVDPHAPPDTRVNGVVSNIPEFGKAFACRLGDPMVRNPACRVW